MNVDERHLIVLRSCLEDLESMKLLGSTSFWSGKSPKNWTNALGYPDVLMSDYAESPITRKELIVLINQYQSRTDITEDRLKFLAKSILAWGGMTVKNGKMAMETWGYWKSICLDLISRNCDSFDAYHRFYELSLDRGKLAGMGPAYYTKLLFFLGGGATFIMDQWTGKSINLLFPSSECLIQFKGHYISEKNDIEVYRYFNRCLERLAEELGQSVANLEELLFSHSPNKKPKAVDVDTHLKVSAWRSYVMNNFVI